MALGAVLLKLKCKVEILFLLVQSSKPTRINKINLALNPFLTFENLQILI